MTWTQHISKTWNRKYWFNSETGKSVWIKPDKEKVQSEADMKTSSFKLEKEKENQSIFESKQKTEEEEIEIGIEKLKLKSKSKLEIQKEDRQSTLNTKKTETKIENDDFRDYEITNGFITTTIRARDKYEAMEEMRSVAQSLNPYD